MSGLFGKLLLALLFFGFYPNEVLATEVICKRTSNDIAGWRDREAFENIWPTEFGLSYKEFSEAGPGSKAMLWVKDYGSGWVRSVRLLPNKKALGSFKNTARDVETPAIVRYLCDIDSNQVRLLQAQEKESGGVKSAGAPTPSTGSEVKRLMVDKNYFPVVDADIKEAITASKKAIKISEKEMTLLREDAGNGYIWNYLQKKPESKAMVGAIPLSCNYKYFTSGKLNLLSAIKKANEGCLVKIQKYNELLNKDCKCRLVAVNNILFYEPIVYLGNLGYTPIFAEVVQNGQKFYIRGTVDWGNPETDTLTKFTLKNDKGDGICSGLFDIRNRAKGTVKLDCFNGRFAGSGEFINSGFDEELRIMNGTAILYLDDGSTMRVVYGRDAM